MDIDDFLTHHGVKGQQWGVVHDEDGLNATDRAVRAKLEPLGYTKENIERNFGPEEKKDNTTKKPLLTDGQKKALKIGAGIAVVGGLAYAANKGMARSKDLAPFDELNFPDMRKLDVKDKLTDLDTELAKMNKLKLQGQRRGLDADAIAKLSTTPLRLEPGSIVQRLSMTEETTIRDTFFACHEEADVGRYKAILPTYWKQWGGGRNPSGFVVKLEAQKLITAPSERETLDIFKSVFDDKFTLPGFKEPITLRSYMQKHSGRNLDDDALAARHIHDFAGQWNDTNNVFTKAVFDKVKLLGYNAIPDLNDANNLANAPHIFLDSSAFKIVGHEVHGPEQIKAAQKEILALVHQEKEVNVSTNDLELFLAHYGVKGQKWGVRRRQSQASKDHATNRKLAAMSDDELQRTVNRIRMEKQYKDLEKSKIKKGHDAAKTILAVGATVNAAIAFSKSPAGKVIASKITKEKALLPLRTLG
jgi:hypothetical protein